MKAYIGIATHAITKEELARSDPLESKKEAYCWAYDNSCDCGPRRVRVEEVEM